ncbi:Hypothetical predicted protein [Octopus vulgaris]|uniref:Uncharacterized protein n=1 Tax=Octopus vulgaris TaxID=6645 RepID=A0AA36FEG7_OCTVU|nr:Hypothetical predicted protein [Octopus vulgaris]
MKLLTNYLATISMGVLKVLSGLDWNLPNYRLHMFRPQYELDQLGLESTNLYYENMVQNWYPNRSNLMEYMSLYEIASKYECVPPNKARNANEGIQLRNKLGYFYSVKERIVKSPNIRLTMDTSEHYYHNLLMLVKPWHDEEKDLLEGCKTYKESFDQCANGLSEVVRFQNVHKHIEDALEHGKIIQSESQTDLNDDYSYGDHMEALADEDVDVNLSCTRNVTET